VTVHDHASQRDVLALLAHDHREVEALFEQLDRLPAGDPTRRDLVNRVTIELVRHSVAEEVYLHPTVRRLLRGGNRLADMEINEHADAEELLKILQGLDVCEVAFDITLTQLMTEMQDHMRDEEEVLFPKLRRAALREELVELGRNLVEARKSAPAHQHAG
jgi:hemerythrin superfamily protein